MTIYISKADAKLYRGEQFAAMQRHLTMQEAAERGAGWTNEDHAILLNQMYRGTYMGGYSSVRAYRENLNT